MLTGIIDPEALHRRLEEELRQSIRESLDLIAEEACMNLRKKIRSQADRIALNLLKQYDVESMGDRIVITVKKDL